MLQGQIKTDMQIAMKEKDELRLNTLRSVLAAIVNEQIAEKKKAEEEISDENLYKILQKLVKQRNDSFKQYEEANRPELAEVERKELEILKQYLPAEMEGEELESIVKETIATMEDKNQGLIMKSVMAKIGSRASGQRVLEVVKKFLN